MRWRLSPLRQRQLRQLLFPQRLTGGRRQVAVLVLLLLTVAAVGRGLYAWGRAHPESQAATTWERYAAALRPAAEEGADGAAVGEAPPTNRAGVTVVEDGVKGAAGVEKGAPLASTDGAGMRAAAGSAAVGGVAVGATAGDAADKVAVGGAADVVAAAADAADSTVATDAAPVPPFPQSTEPLSVQPGSLFDRVYVITDLACEARHVWVNAAAAAVGVSSSIEMFPLANASAVNLRDPPLPVVDVDAEKTPAVSAADVALTLTHRALWRRVFDDKHSRVLVLSDTWFPSRSLLSLLPNLLAAVEAGAAIAERPWHVLLLTRKVPPQGAPETAWTSDVASDALNRTVTVVPTGGVIDAAGGYIISAAGANAMLAGMTAHRAALGDALGSVPTVTTLSACDNARFHQGCPENGVAAPPSVVDACGGSGEVLPASAFPHRAEAKRVAEPLVLPVGA